MPISQLSAPNQRLQRLLPELFNPSPPSGEQFLKLQLTSELTIALALSWVEETRRISTQLVTPIPNTPPPMLGLMGSKGQVFWAVNLAQLLGLPITLESSQYYEAAIIRALPRDTDQTANRGVFTANSSNGLFLGLVVPKIRGVFRLSREDITYPVNPVEASLRPYLSGQVVLDGETILVLSAEALGSASNLESPV